MAEPERPSPGLLPGAGSTEPLSPASFLFLLSATLVSVYLLLSPLLNFYLFGSDSGEYYALANQLTATGHLPVGGAYSGGYTGWGFAYPDFPGLFLIVSGTAGALGVSNFSALIYAIPAISALSVLPLFLLFRRLWPVDSVAILGAAFAAVMMPRAFSMAHPAPLGPGDLFAVAALWMFVEGRTDARWYAPLAFTGGALILTHHLSAYFFLLGALGGLLLLELWRPLAWSRRFPLREFGFLGAYAGGLLLFWFEAAPDFRGVLTEGLPTALASSPGPALLLAAVAIVCVALLVRWRRSHAKTAGARVSYPTDASVYRDMVFLWGGTAGGLALLLLLPLPATSQVIQPQTLVWFAPVIVLIGLAAGSRRLVTGTRIGPLVLTWLAALGLSAAWALSTSSTVVPLGRHAEYLVIPLGLLVAIGLGRLALRAESSAGRPALFAVGIGAVVLLAANAAIVYPPPSDFGGFQEGYTNGDAALWMWVGVGIAPGAAVASDHPLSSMLFGVDHLPATWQSTPALFTGANRAAALAELRSSPAPHGPYVYPISVVAVDGTMYAGVALDPSALAEPLSEPAIGWLGGLPFVPLYENGLETVYWVDGIPASVG
ncbi:MAG: hypothetical protein L3K04_07390 [Thermoplasmata archaeon]|nr:hypothetical protein [Thermoplasmata archaeon]